MSVRRSTKRLRPRTEASSVSLVANASAVVFAPFLQDPRRLGAHPRLMAQEVAQLMAQEVAQLMAQEVAQQVSSSS